jgi:phosphoglycerate dehydrogenase-like enzyme
MTWQVLCAAQSSTVPNGDLSIEAAELVRADAMIIPGLFTSEGEIAAAGERADGLLTLGVGLGRQTLSSLTRCRAIVTASHGYNHLDLAAATELGIPVANTYFCHEPHHTVAARVRAKADATPPGVELRPLAA